MTFTFLYLASNSTPSWWPKGHRNLNVTSKTKPSSSPSLQPAPPLCHLCEWNYHSSAWYGLNCVHQNSHVDILIPVPQNVTLFGNRVTADVINWIQMRSLVGCHPIWLVFFLIKRGKFDTETCTQGERHVTTKAEVRRYFYKPRNTKDCQQTTKI